MESPNHIHAQDHQYTEPTKTPSLVLKDQALLSSAADRVFAVNCVKWLQAEFASCRGAQNLPEEDGPTLYKVTDVNDLRFSILVSPCCMDLSDRFFNGIRDQIGSALVDIRLDVQGPSKEGQESYQLLLVLLNELSLQARRQHFVQPDVDVEVQKARRDDVEEILHRLQMWNPRYASHNSVAQVIDLTPHHASVAAVCKSFENKDDQLCATEICDFIQRHSFTDAQVPAIQGLLPQFANVIIGNGLRLERVEQETPAVVISGIRAIGWSTLTLLKRSTKMRGRSLVITVQPRVLRLTRRFFIMTYSEEQVVFQVKIEFGRSRARTEGSVALIGGTDTSRMDCVNGSTVQFAEKRKRDEMENGAHITTHSEARPSKLAMYSYDPSDF